MSPLPPDRLVHGFYLNELLLKLFARHDSHPDVFALYCTDAGRSSATRTRCVRCGCSKSGCWKHWVTGSRWSAMPRRRADRRRLRLSLSARTGRRCASMASPRAPVSSPAATLLSLAREELADRGRLRRSARACCEPRWIAAWKGASCARRQVMLALRKAEKSTASRSNAASRRQCRSRGHAAPGAAHEPIPTRCLLR